MKPECAAPKADLSLLNLNLRVLHCDGAEPAVFRLFYFDSYGESVDVQPLSFYCFVSKRLSKLHVVHIRNQVLELPRNIDISDQMTFTRHSQSFLFWPLFLFLFFSINKLFSFQIQF